MKRERSILILCVLFCFSGIVKAQSVDSLLAQYDAIVPQEKIYLHFDNTVYAPAQTVWYKAYFLKGNELSDISKIVYLDLFDEHGKLINRVTAPVVGAAAMGNFSVPENYTGSKLQIVAYTKWMLNFDAAFLFRKELIIVQSAAIPSQNKSQIKNEPRINFYPEGGDLVAGLSSVLAFKSTQADGKPCMAKGRILATNGTEVANFVAEHNGMGKLHFTPKAGEDYTAEWTDLTGKIYQTILPKSKNSGVVLTVNDGSPDRIFSVSWSKDLPDRTKKFLIVAHSNQKLLFRAVADLKGKKTITGNIPLSRFPSGVVTITVLDETKKPLAERIVFVNNEEYRIEAGIQFDTIGLQKREKNIYEISIPDSVAASLSLSVTAGDLPADSSDNIITSLLLSSEIKGHILNPAYYFSSEEDSVKQHLDLVMLTHGWRKFKWEEALSANMPPLKYLKDDHYLSLRGTVKDNTGSNQLKKVKTMNLIFQSKDSTRFLAEVPFKEGSWFEKNDLPLFDTVNVFFQLSDVDLKGDVTITPSTNLIPFNSKDSLPFDYFDFWSNNNFSGSPYLQAGYSASDKRGTTLKEVTVKSYKIPKTRLEEVNEMYTSGMFKNGDAYQFDLTDNKNVKLSTNIFTYLQSKVAGLRVENYNGTIILRWRGNNSFGGAALGGGPSAGLKQGNPVAILINEIVSNANDLLDINPVDIAYVKVFRPPFLGVPLGNGGTGAIAVYTRRGEDRSRDVAGIDHFTMTGYTPIRDFYSPDYEEQNQQYTQADLRSTLYWKPDLRTDGFNNLIRIRFYNNDISHSLRVVLEGVSEEGKLIHVSRILK